MGEWGMILVAGALGLSSVVLVIATVESLWIKPWLIRWKLRRQGIRGPPPSFLFGNIPEIKKIMSESATAASGPPPPPLFSDASSVFPHFKHWTALYGESFMFSLGNIQILYVTDTNFVKEINQFKSLDLGKPTYLQKDRGSLLGKGLITTSGIVWLHQRKTLAPQLYKEKVKNMLSLMVESARQLVNSWDEIIQSDGGTADIRVDEHVRGFTSYIISKRMFGDNYTIGKDLFPKCRTLMRALQTPTVLGRISLLRHIPTKKNRTVWSLEKEIYSMIISATKLESKTTSTDMLQTIMEGSRIGELGGSTKEEFVVDNCKDIYLAAFEVTAVAAIWGLMLLASHPEWQNRVRAEIVDVCQGQVPNIEMLSKMKVLGMVIKETLRLYPGVAFVSRQAMQDVKLGKVFVPKDVCIWIWIPALHRDTKLWGPDAESFNPERFSNGVSGACSHPQAYIPFGLGSRFCPGQSLAITEMKVLYALILSKFFLSISPKYNHSPTLGLLLEPKHGVKLLVHKI